MLGKFNVGILGTGNIAAVMADTLGKMKNARLYAVASREKVKADVFAGKHKCKKAYGSYEELVSDKKVDLIYIATPHSAHYENVKLCLNHGKPVLCEKAFTANAAQAEELFKLAAEKNILLTEAIWTRYMPMLTTIREVIGSGVIGEPKTLTANLGYVIGDKERMKNPALAGGALLDVGVYTLNFALMIFGTSISKIASSCIYNQTGVDEQNSITLQYDDGKMAVLCSSMVSQSDRKGIIYGTKGFAIVENINNFESISVYDAAYKKVAAYKAPKQISGYEYEVESCIRAIREHKTECMEMPHSETIRVMKLMDGLRKDWGIVYPFEIENSTEIAESLQNEMHIETFIEEEKTEEIVKEESAEIIKDETIVDETSETETTKEE